MAKNINYWYFNDDSGVMESTSLSETKYAELNLNQKFSSIVDLEESEDGETLTVNFRTAGGRQAKVHYRKTHGSWGFPTKIV